MRSLVKVFTAALLLGGGVTAVAAPAQAGVDLSIGIGVPAYYGYDFYRPCEFYRYHDLPAPARCYSYFYRYWGPGVYIDGDFLFRDRDDWWRWHDRDDYRHWRDHDFHWQGRADWDRRHGDGWGDGGGDRGGWNRGRDNHWNRGGDYGGGGWDRGNHGDRGNQGNRGDHGNRGNHGDHGHGDHGHGDHGHDHGDHHD
ncbi:MAG: hypothetical protein KGJ79_13555 [Alphaproteobacteria bacterium]|nr:hypothetical protein [Alphaproteobacteria bacterium]MDE2495795.1 hypothetical protein [Alphaproteobacteria bacterium]